MLLGSGPGPAWAADTPMARVRVILVGDSTLAPRNGYGDALCQRLAAHVTCLNRAKNGRSSGSYRAEGSWAEVQGLLAGNAAYATTWVLVEFGHNDQPGKPGRSTDLQTEFPANLQRYIDDIRATGALPVLVTPLTRRSFRDGRLLDDLEPWAAAARAVAAAQKVPLIDLHAASMAAVQAMGSEEADTLAVEPPPARPAAAPQSRDAVENTQPARSAFDHTHVGERGARFFAEMMEPLLREALPALAPHFPSKAPGP